MFESVVLDISFSLTIYAKFSKYIFIRRDTFVLAISFKIIEDVLRKGQIFKNGIIRIQGNVIYSVAISDNNQKFP